MSTAKKGVVSVLIIVLGIALLWFSFYTGPKDVHEAPGIEEEYPDEVPDEQAEKTPPLNSPESTPVISEEPSGEPYLLWEVDVKGSAITEPLYADGYVYVTIEDGIQAFSGETGEKIWEIHTGLIVTAPEYADGTLYIVVRNGIQAFNGETGEKIWEKTFVEEYSSQDRRYLIVHEGFVYVGTPEPSVTCLNASSGDMIWRYTDVRTTPRLRLREDNLLVYSMGLQYIDGETGKKLWEVDESLPSVTFYSDKIIAEAIGDDFKFYYTLIDIDSGAILWRERTSDITQPGYYSGIFYFGRKEESTLSAVNTETMEVIWEYKYGKTLHDRKAFDKGILLITYDRKEKVLDRLIFLDWKGSEMWEHLYESITWTSLDEAHIEISGNKVYFLRGGFMEAFDMYGGQKLWETEVGGSEIGDMRMYQDRMYFSADDGRIYCLDLVSGEIIWEFYTGSESGLSKKEPPYISEISDNMLYVVSEEGRLFAFSVSET